MDAVAVLGSGSVGYDPTPNAQNRNAQGDQPSCGQKQAQKAEDEAVRRILCEILQ